MKTKYFFLVGLTICGLLACNNATNTDEFQSPDLSTFWLQGNVKTLTDVDGTKKTFNEQGQLIEAETTDIDQDGQQRVFVITYDKIPTGTVVGGSIVTRDSEGRLCWVGYTNPLACSTESGYYFQYAEAHVSHYWYDYGECTNMLIVEVKKTDEHGWPLQEVAQAGDELYEIVSVRNYEYTNFDEHGNWTERKVSIESTVICYEDEEGNESEERKEETEKRIITYY